jgi:hypothetical protein
MVRTGVGIHIKPAKPMDRGTVHDAFIRLFVE